jgi:hypothetical protein
VRDVTGEGLKIVELAPGLTKEEPLEAMIGEVTFV